MKSREIKGLVYRVRTLSGGFLVEVPEDVDHMQELGEFCAEMVHKGHHITSVTRVFACSTDTPRISVLSSKEYKDAMKRLMDAPKEGKE